MRRVPDSVVGDTALGDGDAVLVTGSTSGIGREVALNIAETGATVLVHGRDEAAARETVATLHGDGHDYVLADFADLSEVDALAERVLVGYDRLDCLVNNAGTWQGERRLVEVPGSEEGVELTFAVNHLAPFLLTSLLAQRLVATGTRRNEESEGDADADTGGDPARVVTVTSGLHRRARLDLDAVRGPEGPTGRDAYALSKLANVLFTAELARRLPESVTANCCHPGTSPATALARDGSSFAGLVWRLFGVVGGLVGVTDSPAEAAETPTYLATSPDVAGFSGEYFRDREAVPPGDGALDREAQRELWQRSVEWTGVEESTLTAGGGEPPARSE